VNSEKLNDWMQVVGIFALVGSLIFVGLQMRQDQDIAVAQIWAMSDQSVAELAGLISEHSAIWTKGLKGEELSEEEQVTFRSIARAIYRRESNIAARVRRLDYSVGAVSRVQLYAFTLYQYPGLRRVFEEGLIERKMQRSAFAQPDEVSFSSAVQKALDELDISSPPVPEQTYMTF
jgi:hypothetical protein